MAPRGAMHISSYLDGEQFDPETQRIMGLAFELTRAPSDCQIKTISRPTLSRRRLLNSQKGASAIQSAFAIMRWPTFASGRIYNKVWFRGEPEQRTTTRTGAAAFMWPKLVHKLPRRSNPVHLPEFPFPKSDMMSENNSVPRSSCTSLKRKIRHFPLKRQLATR